jgi:GNAT superfamily N-acetyltransferase
MQVVVKKVDDLTIEEYKACYSLNLRSNGMMRDKLVHCRKIKQGIAFMIFEGKVLLAWSLVFHKFFKPTDEQGAYFYTRVRCRGQGYASLLIKEIESLNNRITVYPWNNSSDRFFSKNNFKKSYIFWERNEEKFVA